MGDIQPTIGIEVESNGNLFDPLYCATLHNKIIQLILNSKPEYSEKVVRDVFELPHTPIYIDWSERDVNMYPHTKPEHRPPPSTKLELQERLGPTLTTFLQNIDVILMGYDKWGRQLRPGDELTERPFRKETPFLPTFDPPDLNRLYDFTNHFGSEDYTELRNVIQLYPSTSINDYNGSIMFDTFTQTAMYMNIDRDGMESADQSKWVPLDVILRYWLRQIEKGRLYIEAGSFKECQYTEADFAEDVKAWEEYLDVLEAKVQDVCSEVTASMSDVQLDERNRGLVDVRLLHAALHENKLAPIAAALLSQFRRPKRGIKRVGPGLTYFNNESFAQRFSVTALEGQLPASFGPLDRLQDCRQNLLFPAVGRNSELKDNDNYRVAYYQDVGQRPGLYVSVADGSFATVLDHKAGTEIFHCKTGEIPWGGTDRFTLAEMFAAWKKMLLGGHWSVDQDGVAGDFGWFAENRDIEWRENFIWGDIEDADGDMLEMRNDWINDFLPED